MKENNSNKIELGVGHGRDTSFFASNGIEEDALDYSATAIEILDKMAKKKRLPYFRFEFFYLYRHIFFNILIE